jgi:predicted aconitase
MYLTRDEERMLAGEEGPGVAKALQLIVSLGEVFGAERLVPVESAHVSGVSYKNLGEAGLEWLEDQAKLGARARIRATLNPAGMDLTRWEEMGVPEAFAEGQLKVIRAFETMGVDPTCTCTPYLVGNVPKVGSQVAWAESSAICFCNSVLGARTNRESGPTSIASAVTGLAALYEYRLDENRLPGKLVEVEAKLKTTLDYSALGYVTGKMLGTTIPYFRGLGDPGIAALKTLGAACATSGGIALWHGEGVTPEAKAVAPHLKGLEEVTVENSDIAEAKAKFTSDVSEPITCVGCPHCSLEEVAEVAGLVKGRTLKKRLWVFTSRGVWEHALRLGFVRDIEDAGGKIYVDTCMVVAPLKDMGWRDVSLNSFKGAQYCSNMGLRTSLADVPDLVGGALK